MACMSCRSTWRCEFAEKRLIRPKYSKKGQGLLNAGGFALNISRDYADDIKAQLAELEAQRAKIEFSIEAYEEDRAK